MDTEDTGDFNHATVENNREKPSDSFNGKGSMENTDIQNSNTRQRRINNYRIRTRDGSNS